MKEYKVVSHIERMVRSVDFEKNDKSYADVVADIQTTEYRIDENSGKAYKVDKIDKKLIKDAFKGVKVQDFSLENLIATGAVSTLKRVSLEGDIDKSLANIDNLMSFIDSEQAAAPAASEVKSE